MSEPAKVHSLEDIHRALAPADDRPIYTFTVPPAIAQLTGVKTVGIVELTPREMLAAERRGGGANAAETAFELVKESWRRIDGRAITTGDGSADLEWNKSAPGWSKLRTLLGSAHNKIHSPKKDENDAFLASETVTVGR